MKNLIIIVFFAIISGQNSIGFGLAGSPLIQFLKENYRPESTLGYTNARDTLYLKIDRINDEVKGVYTNYTISLPNNVDPSTYLYENGINCEHVWPQSLYSGSEPYKSDMHNLRPCKDNVNSSRGNKPFNESNDYQTVNWFWQSQNLQVIPSSNIDEYSESASGIFEPREDRKGDIARTIYYFYTMYSDIADADFFELQKNILKYWHEIDSPTVQEIDRTQLISTYQDNRPNPFILDLSLIQRAYFYSEIQTGDINVDNSIDVLDIVLIVGIILESTEIEFPMLTIIDFNNDDLINILDIVAIINLILY